MKNFNFLFLLVGILLASSCEKDKQLSSISLNANFRLISPTLNKGLENNFLDQSLGGTDWFWTFENGIPETSIERNPTVGFSKIGPTTVTLIVSNSATNKSDTISETYIVYPGDEMISYYPLDYDADDFSPRLNHGIVNGAELTTDRYGIENRAYVFDGEDDFIDTPQIIDNELASGVTFSAWINATDTTYISAIISNAGEYMPDEGCLKFSGFDFQHSFRYDRGVEFDYRNGSGGFGGRTDTKNKTENGEWFHMAATWNGDLSNDYVMSLYINGLNSNSSGHYDNETSNCGYVESGKPFTIGGRNIITSTKNSFIGSIDEVRIYKRELSQEEITVLAMK